MIEVEHLTKHYGERAAVDDVSFRVDKGEIVGFLGPNGAGKTTTLRLLTGFMAPTGGRVVIDGIDAFERPVEARQRIGYMPESVPLYPELRAHEHLWHRAELKGVPRRRIKPSIEWALEQAGVADAYDRILGQLSKGYRQRIALADALVADPPLLVLDEPTSGLDPNQIRQVRALIRGFSGDKTVFVSTHILPEVEATCERVLIIHRGKVVGQGPPETLRSTEHGAQVVSVVARGAEDTLRKALEGAEGVREVAELAPVVGARGGGELYRARIRTEPGGDAAEAIFRAMADASIPLRELKTEAASLEDVFAHLTTEETRDDEEPPPRGGASDDTDRDSGASERNRQEHAP